MYLSAGANGYSGNIFEIVDISDPAHAVEVSRWALPELKLADPNALNTAWPHGHGLHGPPVIVGNLAYLGFDNKMVILDISDVRNPKEVSELSFDPPYHLLFAVHTVLPFPSRKIVETNSEGGCEDGPSQASLIDVSNPAKPKILSFFPVPVPPPDAPYRDFCERSGGFGAHNVNMLFHNPSIDHSDNIIYMTYTNAGLRVFDIADARSAEGNRLLRAARPRTKAGRRPKKRRRLFQRRRSRRGYARLHLHVGPQPGNLGVAIYRSQARPGYPGALVGFRAPADSLRPRLQRTLTPDS